MSYVLIYKLPLLLIVYIQNHYPVSGWIAGWIYTDMTYCTIAPAKIEIRGNIHGIHDTVKVIKQVPGVTASLF